MTRKPGRPPLPRDGTTIRRLPVHATDDEYNALMAALHADTRERFFQLDGAVTDYNIHVDEIAAERDELLQALQLLVADMDRYLYPDEAMNTYTTKHEGKLRELLAKYDAVTGVTTQEDSDV